MIDKVELSVNRYGWVELKPLGSKFIFRAESIDKRKKRVQEPSGHGIDEAIAEGCVKFTTRSFNIFDFLKK